MFHCKISTLKSFINFFIWNAWVLEKIQFNKLLWNDYKIHLELHLDNLKPIDCMIFEEFNLGAIRKLLWYRKLQKMSKICWNKISLKKFWKSNKDAFSLIQSSLSMFFRIRHGLIPLRKKFKKYLLKALIKSYVIFNSSSFAKILVFCFFCRAAFQHLKWLPENSVCHLVIFKVI